MSKRLLLNLLLVVVLSLLIGLAFLNPRETVKPSVFSQLEFNTVDSITIEHKQQRTRIKKFGDSWQITEPFLVETDEFRIQAILNILSENNATHYEITEADYKKFSLNPPLATLTLNQQQFLFGSTSPVNNQRYVLTNNKLFLVSDTHYALISSGFKNIIRRQLFPSNTKFSSIDFNNTHLSINEKGGWQSNHANQSSDDIQKFITNWQHIQAFAVTDASKPYSGTRISFKTTDNQIIKRIIRQTDINTIVINPETKLVYQLDTTAFDSLTKLASSGQP